MIEGLKPYPKYKKSKLPGLHEIPSQWIELRAKYLFREVDERSSLGSEELLSVSHKTGVTPRSQKNVTMFLAESNVGHKICRPGDVVINTMWAWMAALGVSRLTGLVSPSYGVYRPKIDASPLLSKFADNLLRTEYYRAEYVRQSTGVNSSRLRLYPDQFLKIPILVPAPDEQAAIVKYIDYIDGKIKRYIRVKEKLIRLLEEEKRTIIHHVVTRGLVPNVPLKPSGLAWPVEIPEHWEILPLGRLLAERKEKNDPIKTDNILSLSLSAGVIPYADKKPGGNKAKEDLSAYMLAYPGDIVLNSMNVVVGSVGLSKYFGAVSPVYYMLHPRHADDSVEFFDNIFQDSAFQRSLFGLGNGILVIQSKSSGKLNTIRMRIPMTKLKRVQLPYPKPAEQAAIVDYLAQSKSYFEHAADRVRREVALLQEYRTRVISDVVTGKLDVRDAAPRLRKEAPESEPLDEMEDLPEDDETAEDTELEAEEAV